MPDSRPPRICDYEGSDYRTDFWEKRGREYEDRVERIALRRLLPHHGCRLLEIGAGFGRLTNEYHAYDQVVLLDYSLSQLQYAQERLGTTGRYIYVAADAYQLPFRPGTFDAATMIRVVHHMADVPAVLAQVRRVLLSGAAFILEHANKRNFKAMLRYALRRQTWNPYLREPVEFVELNFDFHPEYIVEALQAAGFLLEERIPVSFFRLPLLKNTLPTGLLAGADGLLQYTGMLYTPSIFVRSVTIGETERNIELSSSEIFVCPQSGGELIREGDTLICQESGLRYAIRDGIYDFKAPLD
jgi:ubiquinone/menaquinone biosynthesis C-methylase UbiE